MLDENAVAKAHAVYTPCHARDLRRAGSRPFQSLRLALSDGAPVELYREISLPIIWRRGWARVCCSIALQRQS